MDGNDWVISKRGDAADQSLRRTCITVTSKTSPPHSTTGVGANVRADSIFVDFAEMIATDLGAEKFFCCQMGEYNGNSWVEKPDLSIKVKDTSGQFKHCSMNAMDKSASSDTYQCKSLSDHTIMLSMNALRFDIEDKSPLT